MKTYRIGLIGLGGMAYSHVHWMKELERFEIVAISDINPVALEQYGNRLGIDDAKRYRDYKQLIEDQEVDAVVSVTPNDIHANIMTACIEAGKPFLGEKPFTRTFDEAKEVFKRYEQKPIPAMIGFSYRYTPAFRYMRELIQQGQIGEVRSFSIQYLQSWGTAKQPFIWRFDKAITGTGTLGDLGSHMIDIARFLFGGEFEELSAQMKTIFPQRFDPTTNAMIPIEVDDVASFQARMTGDIMGIFHTSRNAIGSGNQHEASVYGDLGTLHASTVHPNELIWMKEENGQIIKQIIDVPQHHQLKQYEHFLALLDGTADDTLPTMLDGYRNQQVLEAIVQSSEQKLVVKLEQS